MEGSELHWSTESYEYWIEEPDVSSDNSDRSEGEWWMEGRHIYWVGNNNQELRYRGPVVSSVAHTYKGDVWIENGFLHYVDADGQERITCWNNDEDNFFSSSCGGEDCDDSDLSINPNENELCDGMDNDCDGYVDEGDLCGSEEECQKQKCVCIDDDGDGYKDEVCGGQDCDDSNPSQDPDTIWYNDNDGDYYYEATKIQCADPGPGWSMSPGRGGGDCDDSNSNINPGEQEECDGIDHDCDGRALNAESCGGGSGSTGGGSGSTGGGSEENDHDSDEEDPPTVPT